MIRDALQRSLTIESNKFELRHVPHKTSSHKISPYLTEGKCWDSGRFSYLQKKRLNQISLANHAQLTTGSHHAQIPSCARVLPIFGPSRHGCLYVTSFSNALACSVFFFRKMVVELLTEAIKYNFCLNNWQSSKNWQLISSLVHV